uniref:EF-hand domain-containing protein n=1 Tax=Alexandrium monilatum TaxID=311494 RepID=A0A7S4WDI4_9DINO
MSRVLPARPITLTSASSFSVSGRPAVAAAAERTPTEVLFDALDRNHDGVLTRSEFNAGMGNSVSIAASHVGVPVRRAEVRGTSVTGSAAPSVAPSVASSYVPQPVRGASVSVTSGLSQGTSVQALVEARVLQTSVVGQPSPRPPSRQLTGPGTSRLPPTAVKQEARPASPVRAVSLAGPLPMEPQATGARGRQLSREEMMRTGRLLKTTADVQTAVPAQPASAAAVAAPRPVSGTPLAPGAQQAAEPATARATPLPAAASRPEGPEFGPRWAVICRAPAQQASPAEPLVRTAEPVVAPLPAATPPTAAAQPEARLQGNSPYLDSSRLRQQPMPASGPLSPQSVDSTSAAVGVQLQQAPAGAAAAAAAASAALEGMAAGPRTGTLTPITVSAAEVRLRGELEEMRGTASSEASSAAQLRLQLRTMEAAVRAANLQAESAAAQARTEAQAVPAPESIWEESEQLAAEIRESRTVNSQLKVELACVAQVRDNLQLDLQEEVRSAGALRQQLEAAEATVWDLGQNSGAEVKDLRSRNAELEAEAARHLRVCDRIYEDYAGQTELNSQLKHELAVAQELARASMDYPANDVDDGENIRQQMRIMELEAERMQQQGRIIELEALAVSAAARHRELEQSLEEERARAAHLQQLLDEQALRVREAMQPKEEAASSSGRAGAAGLHEDAAPASPPTDVAHGRQDRLLKALEAEQAKVSRLREALVAAEERAQQAEQARLEAETAAAVARAASLAPASPEREGAGGGSSVSLRDLAWENAGGAGEALPEACPPGVQRQLSTNSKDRLFEAASSDDVGALRAALQGEEDAVMAVLRARDGTGRTLLQVAIISGSEEAATFILGEGQRWAQRRKFMFQLQGELLERELGRFVNGQDHYGQNALAVLCSAPTATREVFIMLMEAQADPTQRDMTGKTPFLECAKSGNVQVMGALLRASRGVALADVDDANRSALHWAAHEGQQQAVELLLKANADADAADLEGNTAADLARVAGHIQVAQMLAEAMSDEALDEFMEQAGGGTDGPRGSRDEGYDVDEGEDFDIPQEDPVHARVPRSFEDSDDDVFIGASGHGPGGGSERWTSL